MNYPFPPELIEKLKSVARIDEVAGDMVRVTVKAGKMVGDCPKCNTPEKITITKGKNIAKCFKCGDKAMDPMGFVMHYGDMTFPEAVRWMAKKYSMEDMLPKAPEPGQGKPKAQARPDAVAQGTRLPKVNIETKPKMLDKKTFRDRSLEASGITTDMQRMEVTRTNNKGQVESLPAFDRYIDGTIDYKNKWAVSAGVDMLMRYIGLDCEPMTFTMAKGNRTMEMVRVRFENPELHEFNGKATKYISPSGSGLHLWLPNKLIKDYRAGGVQAKVLTIQEGEKKADRVCEAVPSVGIMGIHSLVRRDEALPREFEMLIDRFGTETVVFFMDADLFELGRSVNEPVDYRPRLFAGAAKKFRHHFNKFQRDGRRLNLLIAYPKTLDEGIKGMDDLLQSGKLTNEELRDAISGGILGRPHPLIQFHDLTLCTDGKIDELWHLNSHSEFAEANKEKIRVRNPHEFMMGKMRYRFTDGGALELAQPMAPSETFYEVVKKGKGEDLHVRFSNTMLLEFLHNRGFYRYRETDEGFSYIREEDNLVVKLPEMDIRDFVNQFLAIHEERNLLVRDYFLHNWEQFLGKRTFSSLNFKAPLLLQDERARKHFIFRDSIWNVTPTGVEIRNLSDMPGSIWKSSLIQASPTYSGPLYTLTLIDRERVLEAKGEWRRILERNEGRYTIELTKAGEKCVFLQFLINSSDFYWEKEDTLLKEKMKDYEAAHPELNKEQWESMAYDFVDANSPYTMEERFETQQHLIAKLTAIGHLLHKYRSPDRDYWIFAMEGNLIEDSRSEGRSGKSLIPKMLEHVVPVVNIDGRKDMEKDIYIWDKVSEQTQVVNIDDAGKTTDVQRLFPRQTGDFGVRGMNKGEVLIPYAQAPKGYMSSNYALLGSDGSTRDRWRPLTFSDYYSADRKPQDIHGHLFYWDWDDEQKSLFYSLMADSVMSYFKTGGVLPAPSERVEMRRWLQELGKDFKEWADRTFLVPSMNGGEPLRTGYAIAKLEALGMDGKAEWSFYAKYPAQRSYTKEQAFKRKLWLWCLLNGYIINPGKRTQLKSLSEFKDKTYGGDDKRGGTEYFTIIEKGQRVTDGDEVEF